MTEKKINVLGTLGFIKGSLIKANPKVYNNDNFKPGVVAPINFAHINEIYDHSTKQLQTSDLFHNPSSLSTKFWDVFSSDYINLSERDLDIELTIKVDNLTKTTENAHVGLHLQFIGDDNIHRYLVIVFNRTVKGMHAWCGTSWNGEEFVDYRYNVCSATGNYKLWISHKKDSDVVIGGHSLTSSTERFKVPSNKYSFKNCLIQVVMSNCNSKINPIPLNNIKVKYGNQYLFNTAI